MTSKANFYLDTFAYASLAAFIISGVSAFFGPLAAPAEVLYPFLALVAALLLIWRKPVLYISFMWWVWFLTPEVRRLVDFRTGYTEASLVMLAPLLVTGVALVTVILNLQKLPRPYRFPLAFIAFGLLYAYLVGVLNNGLFAATFDLLGWAIPVIGGSYVLVNWRDAETFHGVTQHAFTWGILLMGVYSLIQYFYLPAWDGYWMDNADINSIGYSEPGAVRVFSTLNSAGPFATVVMVGLLLVFSKRGVVQILGSAAGFAGLALSAVRSAWGGWVLGLLVLLFKFPLRARTRLIGIILLLSFAAVPLASFGPAADLLSSRLESLTNLGNDASFNDRLALYANFPSFVAGNLLGQGLGSTGVATGLSSRQVEIRSLDSGLIAVIYTFGLLGTLYFVGGAAVLFSAALHLGLRTRDFRQIAYTSILVAMLSQLLFNNAWAGIPGMLLWFFPCLCLALEQQKRLDSAETVAKPQLSQVGWRS